MRVAAEHHHRHSRRRSSLKNLFVWVARTARRAAAGVRDARPPQRAVLASAAASARLLHRGRRPGRSSSRVLNDTQQTKQVITEVGDAVAAERALVVVVRSSMLLGHLVAADAARAGRRAAAHRGCCSRCCRKLRKGHRALRQPVRRDDERRAGDGERHPTREVVRRRAVRGATIPRGEQPVRARHGSRDAISPCSRSRSPRPSAPRSRCRFSGSARGRC